MLTAILLATSAVLSTLFGVREDLKGKVRSKFVFALVLLAVALISQILQVVQRKGQQNEIDRQEQVIEDANVLLKSNLVEVDEASGGATHNNVAYIVDDDEAGIFIFDYLEAEDKYDSQKLEPMKIVDARPCSERTKLWGKVCDDSKPVDLTSKMIEDLEGAAIHDGKLYLTTTQSNSKDGKEEPQRWLFLEVSLDGKVIRATRKLRHAIRNLFVNGLPDITKSIEESVIEGTKKEVMQIEGLAIDSNGQVYLGFRTPLVDRRALVLRANVDQIFSEAPQFQGFVLNLEHGGDNYGIVSMEYDPDSDEILVLGNSPVRTKTLPTVVWTWKVGDPRKVQHPVAFTGDLLPVFDDPGSRPAKPEVILRPRANRIHLFFDAEGTGGQLSLTRNGTDLRRMGK